MSGTLLSVLQTTKVVGGLPNSEWGVVRTLSVTTPSSERRCCPAGLMKLVTSAMLGGVFNGPHASHQHQNSAHNHNVQTDQASQPSHTYAIKHSALSTVTTRLAPCSSQPHHICWWAGPALEPQDQILTGWLLASTGTGGHRSMQGPTTKLPPTDHVNALLGFVSQVAPTLQESFGGGGLAPS